MKSVRVRGRISARTARSVRGELRPEGFEQRIGFDDAELFEQVRETRGKDRNVAQVTFDLSLERPQQFLLSEALAHALERKFRERLETRLSARVLTQPDEGSTAPVGWNLIIQQGAKAAEDRLRGVDVWQQETLAKVEGL